MEFCFWVVWVIPCCLVDLWRVKKGSLVVLRTKDCGRSPLVSCGAFGQKETTIILMIVRRWSLKISFVKNPLPLDDRSFQLFNF